VEDDDDQLLQRTTPTSGLRSRRCRRFTPLSRRPAVVSSVVRRCRCFYGGDDSSDEESIVGVGIRVSSSISSSSSEEKQECYRFSNFLGVIIDNDEDHDNVVDTREE